MAHPLAVRLALGLILLGCSAPAPSRPPAAPPGTPPASPPTPSPAPAPAPPAVAPASAPGDTALPPKPIPRDAVAYRARLLRIWRFYFALAQPPSVGFAQVHQESRWNTLAASKYASGLAQFTPATARDYAGLLPDSIRATCPTTAGCPTEPTWALFALSQYDFRLFKQYPWAATTDDRWRLALAAYNGGGGWLTKERVRAGNATTWAAIADACMRSVESCKENRGYPVVILTKWLPYYKQWLGQ